MRALQSSPSVGILSSLLRHETRHGAVDLENCSVSNEKIRFGTSNGDLDPDPIRAGWILAGNPVTRSKFIGRGADGAAITHVWECTAGRFRWEYPFDETIYLIEGSVTVKDQSGICRTVNAGDTIFFPAGSSAEWCVARYVRKIALSRTPLPKSSLMPRRVVLMLKRLVAVASSGVRKGSVRD